MQKLTLIRPDWPLPEIVAFTTTRAGGCSSGVYSGLNLGHHVGDNPADVAANRRALSSELSSATQIQWLSQVHGCEVVLAGASEQYPEADASWTRQRDQACAILSADCLPVLFCDRNATVVAAAHAGWRGLAAGVLETTLAQMATDPRDIFAWLGPAIGTSAFEVGSEVRNEFLDTAQGSSRGAVEACFCPHPDKTTHYLADLYGLARQRLKGAGVENISGGGLCTYSDEQRFYSYRRNGNTGRMASVIYLKPH